MSVLCPLEGIYVPTDATTRQAASTAHVQLKAMPSPLMDAAARVKNLYWLLEMFRLFKIIAS